MSTPRRGEILRAEESIRALANELASAQLSRQDSEAAVAALQEALDDVKKYRDSLKVAQKLLRDESNTSRERLEKASEDLSIATDYAHERLKQSVDALVSTRNEIESRSAALHEDLRDLKIAVGDDLKLLGENMQGLAERIDLRSEEGRQAITDFRTVLNTDIGGINHEVAELRLQQSQLGRLLVATIISVVMTGIIIVLIVLVT